MREPARARSKAPRRVRGTRGAYYGRADHISSWRPLETDSVESGAEVKASVLAVALLASGCAKPGHFRPSNLTPLETDAASQAFGAWCSARGGSNCAVLDPDGNATVEVGPLPDPDPDGWGMFYPGLGKIIVRDGRNTPGWLDVFRAIVLHEIGHYYACSEDHGFSGPSAMGKVSQAIAAKGVVDLTGLRARGVCPRW